MGKEPTGKERTRVLSNCQGKAQNRLRIVYAEQYREFYLEEVRKAGITLRGEGSTAKIQELSGEIERLKKLLKERGKNGFSRV